FQRRKSLGVARLGPPARLRQSLYSSRQEADPSLSGSDGKLSPRLPSQAPRRLSQEERLLLCSVLSAVSRPGEHQYRGFHGSLVGERGSAKTVAERRHARGHRSDLEGVPHGQSGLPQEPECQGRGEAGPCGPTADRAITGDGNRRKLQGL